MNLDKLLDRLFKGDAQKPRRLRKPPKPQPPKPVERAYFKDLRPLLSDLKAVTQAMITPSLLAIVENAKRSRPKADSVRKADDFVDDIDRVFGNAKLVINRKWTDEEMASIAARNGKRTSDFNANQLNRSFKAVIGVGIPANEPWLRQEVKAFTKTNVGLIKSIPDQYFDRIERQVTKAAQQGILGDDLAQSISKEYDIAENRAKLIARDQVSKFNGDLTKTRQESVGVSKYEWSTSGDERVRESHEANDGKVFAWDDPPAETGHPGDDVNCRCTAIPVFDEKFLEGL